MTAEPVPFLRRAANSLLASAKRLTGEQSSSPGRNRRASYENWQADAWEMYDLVGEQRFLATTLSNRMAQARFFVGDRPTVPTDAPQPTENEQAQAPLLALGGPDSQFSQLVARLGVNLFIAGEGWLVGVPHFLLPGYSGPEHVSDMVGLDEIEWRVLSVDEVTVLSTGEVVLNLGDGDLGAVRVDPDDIWLIRIWRPHPRLWDEADSPTRASLPVLRELVGLTMHISAQVDSRLAGAGLLVIPQSAQRSLAIAAGAEGDQSDDQFTDALIEAMMVPIQDRASASAIVPLCVTVPDEVTGNFNYITFAKPLDAEARELRDEAIRRLALGQDAPPELLLGTSGMNHWGAWLVREDVVSTHIEPPLQLICDALTAQFLWPTLIDQGMPAEQVRQYVVHYDVQHMVTRPNRAAEASDLHDKGVLSDEALRNATGFDETDAPTTPSAVDAALFEMVTSDPSLLASPGVTVLREQLTAVVEGTDIEPIGGGGATNSGSAQQEAEVPEPPTEGPPTEVGPAPEPSAPPVGQP